MKIEFSTINSEDKKKVESPQSVKVRGQSLIAVVANPPANPPSRDNVRQ